jgi:DNA-directed RNA polymerase specialized sigma24 family protein
MRIEDEAWRFVERTRKDFEGIIAKHCSREEAQDAVCDAALRLVKHAHRSDPEKWGELFKQACFSAMVDNIRKVKRQVKTINGKEYGRHYSFVKPDMERVGNDPNYAAVDVLEVVNAIPDAITRRVVILRLRGWKFADIGTELNITEGAAKCRAIKVRKDLEEYL